MKSAIYALVAAVLVAGLVLTPASAAPLASTCGDTYTVQRGDYLKKIAVYCGVSLSDLVAANPQIYNYNLIYPGQVIRITPGSTPSLPVTGTTGNYTVRWGDTLAAIAWRYGTTVANLMSLNPAIMDPWRIYAGQVITVPSGTSYTGPGPYYPNPTYPTSNSYVSISSASVKAGSTFTVSVWGFPANADIDFRLGKQGAAASVFVDAKTDASGRASATLTIPGGTASGEKWVVLVLTTSMGAGQNKEVTSPVITIAP